MTDSLRTSLSEPLKVKYRKVKTVPVAIKAAVYGGCRNPDATIQFHRDVQVYGLYEALLYVESYEKDGYYHPGTALAAGKLLK